MDIIQYFSDNHASLLFLLAGIAFVIELAVMGLSGFVLFFAIGCFITGILSYIGILSGWESEAFSVGVLSCISALILWKPLKRFQIAGKNKKWYWANARIISKNKIEVSHPEVPEPEVVRYAWSNNPNGANLYNKEGLPASVFTTEE